MSVAVSAWVWKHSPSSGNDRLALLALADEADDDGANCRPSIARIAAKCNIDKGTAIDVVKRLEAAGELIVKRPETYGRGRYNEYVLTLSRDPGDLARRFGFPTPPAADNNGGESPPLPAPDPVDNPRGNGGETPPITEPKRWRDPPEKVASAPPDPKTDPYVAPRARQKPIPAPAARPGDYRPLAELHPPPDHVDPDLVRRARDALTRKAAAS